MRLMRSMRAVDMAEAREDPLPEFRAMDQELSAMSDMLETLMTRVEKSRQAEVMAFLIRRLSLTTDVARLIVNSVPEDA